MANPPIQPRTFHNNRFVIFCLFAFAAIVEAMAICMALMAIYEVFVSKGSPFMRGLSAIQWAGGGYCFVLMGWAVWRVARRADVVHVKFDANGVDFRLGSPKAPEEVSMAWDQVTAISKQTVGNNWLITITAKDGSWASYSPYNFFRYMKLARLISACAAVPITVLPAQKAPVKVAKESPVKA
ncbi:MAG TPA: hypothetical protein VGD60_00335 [Candidatus Acidoferrales bacterium]